MDREAKPRDEVESFSLKISGKGSAFTHSCPTLTMLAQDRQGQKQGKGRKPSDCPMAPRPFPSCSMSYPWPGCHSHTLTPVCTPTHTSHTSLVTVTAWPLSCESEPGHPPGTAQKESGLGGGDIRVALRVSEQHPHIPGRPGFRSSDLRQAH